MIGDELVNAFDYELQHRYSQTRKNSEPERPLGHDIGVSQVTHHPMVDAPVSRLAEKIASEQLPGPDPLTFEKAH